MRFASRSGLAAMLLCFTFAAPGLASGPAMRVPEDPAQEVQASFRSFAKGWMDKALARAERNQLRPRAQERGNGLTFLYRGVADAYQVALEPTGSPASPYVGVLRYTEQTFQCRDAAGAECTLTASEPVSEVFRFRGGRWSY